jgi:hypothetical protein
MHFSWGAGILLGCIEFGPPVEAIKRGARVRKPEERY